MGVIYYLLGVFSGSTILLITLGILAVSASNSQDKGEDKECTNQKQQ